MGEEEILIDVCDSKELQRMANTRVEAGADDTSYTILLVGAAIVERLEALVRIAIEMKGDFAEENDLGEEL